MNHKSKERSSNISKSAKYMEIRYKKCQTHLPDSHFIVKLESDDPSPYFNNCYPSPLPIPESPNKPNGKYDKREKGVKKSKFSKNPKKNSWFNDNFKVKPFKSRGKKLKLCKSRKDKKILSKEFCNEVVFPNWGRKESFRSAKKRDFDFINKDGYATHCYICENRVKLGALHCHLYFGHVKCEDCGRIFTSCLKFSNPKFFEKSKCDKNCKHEKLDWVYPPVDNLKKLWDEDEEAFDKSLIFYLRSLEKLKSFELFKKAFDDCNNYLEIRKSYCRNQSQENSGFVKLYLGGPDIIDSLDCLDSTVTTNAETTKLEKLHLGSPDFTDSLNCLDSTVTTNAETTKLEKLHLGSPDFTDSLDCLDSTGTTTAETTIRASSPICTDSSETKAEKENISEKTSSEIDKIHPISPENEFYLISKKVLDECPNCYEIFQPQNLIFNSGNWLISVTCQNCFLLVYFLLDPPDGSMPKLKIINTL